LRVVCRDHPSDFGALERQIVVELFKVAKHANRKPLDLPNFQRVELAAVGEIAAKVRVMTHGILNKIILGIVLVANSANGHGGSPGFGLVVAL
jgi:hypothetical protein